MKRAAVIGLGSMGANHARVYSQLNGVELVGCSDVNSNSKFSDYPFYTDYNEMLKKESPDFVSICVPTTLHKAVATYALSQGINTLVEKPIADSEKNALAVINAAKKSGAKLAVGHIERFNPVISALKTFLFSNGAKIFSINIERVGPIPPRIKDVGVVLDLGTHDIDLISFLTKQKISSVYCTTNTYSNPSKHEDSPHINLTLSSGISATITTNWLTPYKQRKIEVITDKNVVQGDLKEQKLFEFSKSSNSQDIKEIPVEKSEPLALELQAFVNNSSTATGEEGLYALKIAQLCLKSAKGKKVVKVP